MRKFFLAGSAALSLFAIGCTPSPQALCETGTDTTCDRLFECASSDTKNSDTFKGLYGTSASECKTKLAASNSCSSKKTDDDLCTGGKKFNLDNASACLDGIKKLSCDDFNAGKLPSTCATECQ